MGWYALKGASHSSDVCTRCVASAAVHGSISAGHDCSLGLGEVVAVQVMCPSCQVRWFAGKGCACSFGDLAVERCLPTFAFPASVTSQKIFCDMLLADQLSLTASRLFASTAPPQLPWEWRGGEESAKMILVLGMTTGTTEILQGMRSIVNTAETAEVHYEGRKPMTGDEEAEQLIADDTVWSTPSIDNLK